MDSETFQSDFTLAHKLSTIKLVKATWDAINVRDLVGKYLLGIYVFAVPPGPRYFSISRETL